MATRLIATFSFGSLRHLPRVEAFRRSFAGGNKKPRYGVQLAGKADDDGAVSFPVCA